MKNKLIILSLILFSFTLYSTKSLAQFNPYTEEVKMLSVGLGVSGWGIPIYVRFEMPVADNITVGGGLSFQSQGNSVILASSSYRTNTFGIVGRGNYHFNDLLNAPDEWDFYAGASIGYFIRSNSVDNISVSNEVHVGVHVGARYFLNEKIALNAEAGGGIALSGASIGVTFFL